MSLSKKAMTAAMDAFARPVVQIGAGLALAVLTPQRQCWQFRGLPGGPQASAEHTVFELGSISKLYTGILLAQMHLSGRARLTDAVVWLRQATLFDLATHHSGLPRLPDDLDANSPDPYKDYGEKRLRAYLACAGKRAVPGQFTYSNLGAGLLGHVLSCRLHTSYAQALRMHVLSPLGLRHTFAGMSRVSVLPGHAPDGRPVSPWHWSCLAGAGALRGSLDDVVRFVRTNLRPASAGSLGQALKLAQETRRVRDGNGNSVALGWLIDSLSGGLEAFWHNGATGGFSSFVGMVPDRRLAVIALCNYSIAAEVTAGAFELLQKLAD